MAKVILDKNLNTEKEFNVLNFSENTLSNVITANYYCIVETTSELPAFPPKGDGKFTTVNLETDTGVNIPVVGTYNTITNYLLTYDEENRVFNFHLALAYEAE